MEFDKCQRCGKYQWNPITCGCRLFLCWIGDEAIVGDENESTLIYADTGKEATEKAARKWYQADTTYTPDSLDVWVRDGFDGEITAYTIVAEPRIDFTAHLK